MVVPDLSVTVDIMSLQFGHDVLQHCYNLFYLRFDARWTGSLELLNAGSRAFFLMKDTCFG